MHFPDTFYTIIQPTAQGNFHSDWQSCLTQMVTLAKDKQSRIFKINLFVHATDIMDFKTKKSLISAALLDTFGDECPTFGILASSPEKPYNLMIEIGLVNSSSIKIDYRKYKSWRYTIIERSGYKELWANGIESETSTDSTKTASEKAFKIMRQILLSESMTCSNIIRQWNYIGEILSVDSNDSLLTRNYEIFNCVRHNFYRNYRLVSGFPAATGVGMKFSGVMIDFYAIAANEKIQIVSINNPIQINPYNYDQSVLAGKPFNRNMGIQPPLFERAKLLIYHDKWRMFVSGTASIIGQETTGKYDLLKQTKVTIENIQKLTSPENLASHSMQLMGVHPNKYGRIRVYVKNANDIHLVKSICTHHFGSIPAIYIQSDICRTDLLVEIETDL